MTAQQTPQQPGSDYTHSSAIDVPSLFSDFDFYLFGQGKHYHIYEKMGAHERTVEGITGVALTPLQRATIVKGASELELVNSGLEDTMIRSYHEIRETYKNTEKIDTLRTAAFVVAINKIAGSYKTLGVWP